MGVEASRTPLETGECRWVQDLTFVRPQIGVELGREAPDQAPRPAEVATMPGAGLGREIDPGLCVLVQSDRDDHFCFTTQDDAPRDRVDPTGTVICRNHVPTTQIASEGGGRLPDVFERYGVGATQQPTIVRARMGFGPTLEDTAPDWAQPPDSLPRANRIDTLAVTV